MLYSSNNFSTTFFPVSTMAFPAFARDHVAQITATVGLVTYALARNKLTPGGIVAGVAVAIIHMAHPWPAFFWLLIAFFVVGTGVTKVPRNRFRMSFLSDCL